MFVLLFTWPIMPQQAFHPDSANDGTQLGLRNRTFKVRHVPADQTHSCIPLLILVCLLSTFVRALYGYFGSSVPPQCLASNTHQNSYRHLDGSTCPHVNAHAGSSKPVLGARSVHLDLVDSPHMARYSKAHQTQLSATFGTAGLSNPSLAAHCWELDRLCHEPSTVSCFTPSNVPGDTQWDLNRPRHLALACRN